MTMVGEEKNVSIENACTICRSHGDVVAEYYVEPESHGILSGWQCICAECVPLVEMYYDVYPIEGHEDDSVFDNQARLI